MVSISHDLSLASRHSRRSLLSTLSATVVSILARVSRIWAISLQDHQQALNEVIKKNDARAIVSLTGSSVVQEFGHRQKLRALWIPS